MPIGRVAPLTPLNILSNRRKYLCHTIIPDPISVFRMAMRATLVKEARDVPTFERLFPLYFGAGAPPLQQPGGGMSEQEREQLMQLLTKFSKGLEAFDPITDEKDRT